MPGYAGVPRVLQGTPGYAGVIGPKGVYIKQQMDGWGMQVFLFLFSHSFVSVECRIEFKIETVYDVASPICLKKCTHIITSLHMRF